MTKKIAKKDPLEGLVIRLGAPTNLRRGGSMGSRNTRRQRTRGAQKRAALASE